MAKTDDTFFELFKSRWKLATEAEQEQRQKELDDLNFEAGAHWDERVANERKLQGKPCLVIDLLSGPIKQVTNQQRTARPGIQISPVGNGADPKKAERWQGIIRRVERLSQAGRVYSWAGQYQAKMGRGFWMLRNIEVGPNGEQDIRIKALSNQHSAYCDPTTKELDGSDKKWAMVFEDLTHEEYKARFGDSALAEAMGDAVFKGGVGDDPPDWITSEHIRICEYYYLEEAKRTKHILDNGSSVYEDELETESYRDKGKFASRPKFPKGTRSRRAVKETKKTVHWCLLNGRGEKLDSTTIPGEFIPVVMIWGERRNIAGKTDYRGLVRMAKSPSYMEDFLESSLMEAVTYAKTAPWLAEWDQISEFEKIWASSARSNPAYLPYKRVSGENGAPIPPPQRITASVDVAALTMAAQRMQNHVRATTGIPDIFQEETAAQQANASGRAILARKAQQELGTSDYLENLGDGIVLTAKIIMSMARDGVYDTPRLMRIWGEDEKEHEVVTHFGPEQIEQARQLQTRDVEDVFDLSVGDYDVAISVGKNYQTAREEAVDAISAAIQAYPPIAQTALPILFKNSDWPGAMELAKALNPNDENIPPQVMQRLQEADQLLQMAKQRIDELEKKEAGGLMKAQFDTLREEIKGQVQHALQVLKGRQAIELEREKVRGQAFLQDDEQAHELGIESATAEHEAEQARQQAEHDRMMLERQGAQDLMSGDLDHRRTMQREDRQGTRDAMSADLEHRRTLAQNAQGHRHTMQQSAQGHKQTLQQIKAKPKPTNGAKRK